MHKKGLLYILFMLFSANSFCQTVIDSSASEGGEVTDPADTTLTQANFTIKPSDIEGYRSSKDFAYMQYLDSLLKQTKDLKVDTLDINFLRANGTRRTANQDVQETQSTQSTLDVSFLDNPFLRILFWLLAAGFVGFILFKLFSTGNFFKRKTKELDSREPELEQMNLGIEAYDGLIRKAVSDRNYSLAVRYRYLQTLQKLNDRNIIELSPGKTNYQYVRELANKSYQNEFASLTLNYDYVWYGKFDVQGETYERIENDFKIFQQKI
jgi:hypothetical protein